MNIQEILKYLPHRYPMLLVDKILELEPGVRCVGLKNVTMNEPFFQGHYPGMPIMPGVIIVEAMAQAGAMLVLTNPEYLGKIPLIGSIDEVRFRRPVVPGDALVTTVRVVKLRSSVGKVVAEGTVDGELACSMVMTFMLVDRTE
ncbi:MAG: 3-hydroxyacyl-ACP dehydratase FabZ [Fimbriimonadaceae bacterium]|nr:3-hydroxyacyl-ACP dehydratase FabZ [Fimbriimonadaceae bacterium]